MKIIHMIIYAFALALSMTMGAQSAQAANGDRRFCDTPVTNVELEKRLSDSLAIDPTGHHALEGCRANPLHFFIVWKDDFPTAKLTTVQDLLPFVRELKPKELKKDMQYSSGCLRERPDRVYDAIRDCIQRPARKGETVYAWHGKPALMSSCANPGVIEIPPIVVNLECVELDFPSEKAIPTRYAYIGPRPIPSQCVRLHIAGESQARLEMPNECPSAYTKTINGHIVQVVCDWREDERAVSQLLGVRAAVQNVSGSFYGRGPGMNKLYLPKEALEGETVVCWELPDGRIITTGVRRQDFRNGVAVITEQEMHGRR